MGRILLFLLVILLTGCIPRGNVPEPRPAAPPARGNQDPATIQCHVDLAREGVRFRRLEDRGFENGCHALGAVQLLEIGTPVANLGTMTCPLARAFARWVQDDVQPAAQAAFGQPVRRIESMGTYTCRPVNGRSGARISEHGFANAVDVAAFVLGDGRRITVAGDWRGGDERAQRFLRDVHRAGCRRFAVGLGPDADRFHQDHLHFDLGRGPYCR